MTECIFRLNLTPDHPLLGIDGDGSSIAFKVGIGANDNILRLDIPFKFPADHYILEGPKQDVPWMTPTFT